MIKIIIFDAGGVLLNISPILGDIQKEFSLTKKDIEDHVLPLLRRHEKGEFAENKFWELLKKRFAHIISIPTPTPLIRKYQKNIKIKKSVLALAQGYKKKGYKIAILSDTIPVHVSHMKKLGLLTHFERLITSYESKNAKPHPLAFRYALRKLGARPEETIFIDDKLENVQGAAKLGINAILFTSAAKLKKDMEKILRK
jgi:putative hydrolase of the HAD superfamily